MTLYDELSVTGPDRWTATVRVTGTGSRWQYHSLRIYHVILDLCGIVVENHQEILML